VRIEPNPAYFTPDNVPSEALQATQRYLQASRALDDRSAWGTKITLAINLFLWHLDAFEGDNDPVPAFVDLFDRATAAQDCLGRSSVVGDHFTPAGDAAAGGPDNVTVGEMYKNAWVKLTDDHYFEQSYERMAERLRLNDVVPSDLFGGKEVLDAGCGAGNYSAAIARSGASRVVAIDINEEALEFARAKAAQVPYGGNLDYRFGSACDIPLPDASFDMVWSNSVVHVTPDYEACFHEFARVLRPGGILFVYVDGKFGLFELLTNTLRESLLDVPQTLFQHHLEALGVDAGRITWMVACCYVPYERRPQREVEALLAKCGFGGLRQLRRGVGIDQIEHVSTGRPYAAVKYGEAQLKYLARKL
jgi:SAM-dependent methyltransferase